MFKARARMISALGTGPGGRSGTATDRRPVMSHWASGTELAAASITAMITGNKPKFVNHLRLVYLRALMRMKLPRLWLGINVNGDPYRFLSHRYTSGGFANIDSCQPSTHR